MKRYEEPIEVRSDERGVPLAFVWRGRSYAVWSVHARWSERRSWWRDLADGVAASSPRHDTEQHLWQVEAEPRRPGSRPTVGERRPERSGIFDLGADGPQGPWRLVRAHD